MNWLRTKLMTPMGWLAGMLVIAVVGWVAILALVFATIHGIAYIFS